MSARHEPCGHDHAHPPHETGVRAHDPAHGHVHGHAHGRHHHHGHGHHHHHHHHHGGEPGDWRWIVAIALNLGFVVAEVVAGVLANSSALLADAGHNLSDVLGLALAGGAAWLAKRAGSRRRTYGYGKATILAALANAVVLVFACGAIAVEAVGRFANPEPVGAGTVMLVAAIGVAINLGTAMLFFAGRKGDLNERGAFLHMVSDAAVSLGVVGSGLLVSLTGLDWIDPVTGLLIVAAILAGTWGLLKESLDMAMDAAPPHLDPAEIAAALKALPGVEEAHHVHVWNLSTTRTALTAHLVRAAGTDAAFLAEARALLKSRFGIDHATLQVEPAGADCAGC